MKKRDNAPCRTTNIVNDSNNDSTSTTSDNTVARNNSNIKNYLINNTAMASPAAAVNKGDASYNNDNSTKSDINNERTNNSTTKTDGDPTSNTAIDESDSVNANSNYNKIRTCSNSTGTTEQSTHQLRNTMHAVDRL